MSSYNELSRRCKTEFIAFIDIDALIPWHQFEKAIYLIKKQNIDFVNPFDCLFNLIEWRVDGPNTLNCTTKELQKKSELHNEFTGLMQFYRNYKSIGENEIKKLSWETNFNWNTPFFVGLCVIVRNKIFLEFGMGNEYFKSWGMADDEWYARAQKLGYSWVNIDGYGFHMDHPRDLDKTNLLGKNNIFELVKPIIFSAEELKAYIKTWPWLHDQ